MYKTWKPALLKLPSNYTQTTAAADGGQPGTQQRVLRASSLLQHTHNTAEQSCLASPHTSPHCCTLTKQHIFHSHPSFHIQKRNKNEVCEISSKTCRGRDGLGRRTGGEGGCRVLPGAQGRERAAGGLRPHQESTLAAHHTRQGVATSKRSVSTVHQMVPRVPRGGRSDGEIGAPSYWCQGCQGVLMGR